LDAFVVGRGFFNEGYDINKEDERNNTMVTAMTTSTMMISFFDGTILIAAPRGSGGYWFSICFSIFVLPNQPSLSILLSSESDCHGGDGSWIRQQRRQLETVFGDGSSVGSGDGNGVSSLLEGRNVTQQGRQWWQRRRWRQRQNQPQPQWWRDNNKNKDDNHDNDDEDVDDWWWRIWWQQQQQKLQQQLRQQQQQQRRWRRIELLVGMDGNKNSWWYGGSKGIGRWPTDDKKEVIVDSKFWDGFVSIWKLWILSTLKMIFSEACNNSKRYWERFLSQKQMLQKGFTKIATKDTFSQNLKDTFLC